MNQKKHSLKSFLIITISLVYLQPCFSQSEKPQKWEVGADILSLFDKNQLPDYSLFATRKIGENGFSLRSRIGFQMDSYKPKINQNTQLNDNQNFNHLILLGIERDFADFQVGKGMSLYWAGDVGFNQLITKKQQTKFVTPETRNFIYSDYKSNNYFLNGSVGVKQKITKNLSLRFESSISYNYENYIGKDYFLSIETNTPLLIKKELIKEAKESSSRGLQKYAKHALSLVPFNQFLLTLKF